MYRSKLINIYIYICILIYRYIVTNLDESPRIDYRALALAQLGAQYGQLRNIPEGRGGVRELIRNCYNALGVRTISRGCFERCCCNKKPPRVNPGGSIYGSRAGNTGGEGA